MGNKTKYNFELFEEELIPKVEQINKKYNEKQHQLIQQLRELRIQYENDLRIIKEDIVEGDKKKELDELLDQIN